MKAKCTTFTLPKCSFVWVEKCKDVTKCKDVWDKVCDDHPKTTCKTVHEKECEDSTERVCEDVAIRVVPDEKYSPAPTYESSDEVWDEEEDRYKRSIVHKLEKLHDKIDAKFEKAEKKLYKEKEEEEEP